MARKLTSTKSPRICAEYGRLSKEYDRVFSAWSALDRVNAGKELLGRLEQKHKNLVAHEQSCAICQLNLSKI